MASSIILPGDILPDSLLPTSASKALKLGPGLRHLPPSTIKATVAGTVTTDNKKNAVWVEYNGGRYIPQPNDLVIATIARSAGEFYNCTITPYAPPALLNQLAFEGATKKTRPQLHSNDLIYARVLSASKHVDVELECLNSNTGKGEGLGPLKGGCIWDVSCQFARRLMMGKRGGLVVLNELSEKVAFEVAVGRNGRVWVAAGDGDVKIPIIVGRALQECDEKNLDEKAQRECVRRLLKGI